MYAADVHYINTNIPLVAQSLTRATRAWSTRFGEAGIALHKGVSLRDTKDPNHDGHILTELIQLY